VTAAATDPTVTSSDPAPTPRSLLRQVGLPSEHGGWGLTLEPALLGLLVAPSGAGVALALAALGCFVARTPLRVVLVDRHRGRHLERDRVALRLLAVELAVLAALVAVATTTGDLRWWIPVLAAAPAAALELWFDLRSRSRRLVPELAGSLAVCAAAPAVVLAGGGAAAVAAATWLVMAARVVAALPFVRAQIGRIHGRPLDRRGPLLGDVAALGLAATAVAVEAASTAGAVAVAAVIVAQRALARHPRPRAALLGAAETALGLGVVLAAGLGLLAP